MGYYLVEGRYTSNSATAMIASPNDRSAVAKRLVESLGGTFHHYFFSLDDGGYLTLCELPDDMTAAALGLALGASGAFSKTKTRKLLTAQDTQAAMQKAASATYSPPAKS